jgi:hypothetical protein
MKRGVVAGAVAGLVGGISAVLFGGIGYQLGLYGLRVITVVEWSVYTIILTVIYGAIFGVIFARIYDSIPGNGILKGVTFGSVIWFIKDITTGIDLAIEREPVSVIAMIWVGFFTWIAYGLVLGRVYKK